MYHFSLGISSISFCGFIFTWQAFSGEHYGRPLFPPLTFSLCTPGTAKSSLIISQAGSVPWLYLSANLISQEWKAAPRGAEERRRTNQKTAKNQYRHIHGHIFNAHWHSSIDVNEKRVNIYQLKKGFHSGPVIFLFFFFPDRIVDQKSSRLSPRVAIKDLVDGGQHTPLRHEGVKIQWKI